MLAEGIALGWILIVLGAVLLLVEVYQPGISSPSLRRS